MSAVVGSKVVFDGELWMGGVAGVGDAEINKSREGKVGGSVSVRRAEIMFNTGWSG